MPDDMLPEHKRKALEHRKMSLVEEYKAVSNQLSSSLEAAQRLRLGRQLDDLEKQIKKIAVNLSASGDDGSQSPDHQSGDEVVENTAPNRSRSPSQSPDNQDGDSTIWKQLLNTLRTRLWLDYVLWLFLSTIGFIADLGDVFGLSSPTQFTLLTVLALVGGTIILIFSVLPANKAKYTTWDRGFTALLTIIVSVGLMVLALND